MGGANALEAASPWIKKGAIKVMSSIEENAGLFEEAWGKANKGVTLSSLGTEEFGKLGKALKEFKELKIAGGVGEDRLIPGEEGIVTGANSTKLGKNMLESMGIKRSTKWSGY